MASNVTGAPRGLEGVVAAQTRLSHVDGKNGVLIVGGYTIEELAGHVGFEAAAHLLWRGHLPDPAELSKLSAEMAELRELPPITLEVLRSAAAAPPIDALRMACATLSLGLADPNAITPEADFAAARRLTACLPTVVAAHARIGRKQEPIHPRKDLPLAANFLYMIHGKEPDPAAAKALDTYWVTVMDHGMNASTFTARVIASTRSDLVSAVTGALGALKGPLHGGAPGPVLDMLLEIRSADRAEEWLRNETGAGPAHHGIRPPCLQSARPARGGTQPRGGTPGPGATGKPASLRSRAARGADGAASSCGSETGAQFKDERGILHGAGSAGARTRSSPVCGHVCVRPHGGLVRARDRAACGRSLDSASVGIYRTDGAESRPITFRKSTRQALVADYPAQATASVER